MLPNDRDKSIENAESKCTQTFTIQVQQVIVASMNNTDLYPEVKDFKRSLKNITETREQ